MSWLHVSERVRDSGGLLRLLLVVASGLILGATFAIVVSLVSSSAPGPNDEVLPWDGFLTNEAGEPLDGVFDIAFVLQGSGARTMTDNHSGVRVIRGRFSLPIGGGSTRLPDWVFEESNLQLQVRVNGTLLSGTQRIYPMPYAYLSLGADDFALASDLELPNAFRTGTLDVASDLEADSLQSGGLRVDGVLRIGPQGGSLAQQDSVPALLEARGGSATLPALVNLRGGRTVSYEGTLPLRTDNSVARMTLGQGSNPQSSIGSRLQVLGAATSGVEVFGAGSQATGMTLSTEGIANPGARLSILPAGGGTTTLGFTSIGLGSSGSFTRNNLVLTPSGQVSRSSRPSPGGTPPSTTLLYGQTTPTGWFCGMTSLGAAGRHYVNTGCEMTLQNQGWGTRGFYSRSGNNSWESGHYCKARCVRF